MNKTTASYTNYPHLRLDIAITIGVSEDLDRVRAILLALVKDNPEYAFQPEPCMVVTALNDYNIAVELQVWLKNEREHTKKRYELREAAFKALTTAKVEMPLETIRIEKMRD